MEVGEEKIEVNENVKEYKCEGVTKKTFLSTCNRRGQAEIESIKISDVTGQAILFILEQPWWRTGHESLRADHPKAESKCKRASPAAVEVSPDHRHRYRGQNEK